MNKIMNDYVQKAKSSSIPLKSKSKQEDVVSMDNQDVALKVVELMQETAKLAVSSTLLERST